MKCGNLPEVADDKSCSKVGKQAVTASFSLSLIHLRKVSSTVYKFLLNISKKGKISIYTFN